METVISLEYNELIRDGEFEMKTQIQDFLDSKVDEWKFSVTTHLWCDHYFRLLRRHFSLQLLVENPGEEPVWVPLPYDSTIAELFESGSVSHSFDTLPYPSPSQSR